MRCKREIPDVPFKVERMGGSTLVEQVVGGLREAILSGFYRPGDVLPSITDLAEKLGVSRIVTRHAVKALADERLIYSRPSAGSVVLDSAARRWRGHVLLVRPADFGCHFQSEEIFAAEECLSRAGYLATMVMVWGNGSGRLDTSALDRELSRNISLVILFGNQRSILKRLTKSGKPFMYVDIRRDDYAGKGCVGHVEMSSRVAMESFVEHCVRVGVRSVSIIGKVGDLLFNPATLEAAGIRVARINVDAPLGPKRVEDLERETCRTLDRLFAQHERAWLPDLIFAADDYQATGALFSLFRHGVEVPEDVCFATVKNFGNGPALPVSLTCVEFNPAAVGAAAAHAAVDFLAGNGFTYDSASGFQYVVGESFPETEMFKAHKGIKWLNCETTLPQSALRHFR